MQLVYLALSEQIDLHLQLSILLVVGGPSRHAWTHAIPSRKTDKIARQRHHRSRRISLTFRTMRLDAD